MDVWIGNTAILLLLLLEAVVVEDEWHCNESLGLSLSLFVFEQTTPPWSWRCVAATAASGTAATWFPWWSRMEAGPRRAAPTRWQCACARATATATWSCATLKRWCCRQDSAPKPWWPYCSASAFSWVSNKHNTVAVIGNLDPVAVQSSVAYSKRPAAFTWTIRAFGQVKLGHL